MRRISQSIAKCELLATTRTSLAANPRALRRAYSTPNSPSTEPTNISTDKSRPIKLEDIKTWDGLERVGSEEWIRKRKEPRFKANRFLNSTNAELDTLNGFMKRALVELLAIRSLGIQLDQKTRGQILEALPQHGSEYTQGTTITLKHGSSDVTVRFKNEGALATLAAALPSSPSGSLASNTQEFTVSFGESSEARSEPGTWREVSLQDPEFKFAFVWRLMSLTGTRISDYAIENSNSVGELYDTMRSTKPKTTKLAEVLEKKLNTLDLPNVKLESEPLRMEEKEKRQGRWKFIEQELMRRNLPLSKFNPSRA